MESIEKLRERCDFLDGNLCDECSKKLHLIADEIEAEIAANYLEMPVDADGVPIRVGDAITLPNGSRDDVRFITIRKYDTVFNERGWVPNQCTHAKPRTLEDVLRDYACDFADSTDLDYDEEITRKCADEIRELLGFEIDEPDTIRNELDIEFVDKEGGDD